MVGKDLEISNQESMDKILLDLDGTKNKEKLGANAILGLVWSFLASDRVFFWLWSGKILEESLWKKGFAFRGSGGVNQVSKRSQTKWKVSR